MRQRLAARRRLQEIVDGIVVCRDCGDPIDPASLGPTPQRGALHGMPGLRGTRGGAVRRMSNSTTLLQVEWWLSADVRGRAVPEFHRRRRLGRGDAVLVAERGAHLRALRRAREGAEAANGQRIAHPPPGCLTWNASCWSSRRKCRTKYVRRDDYIRGQSVLESK